MDAVEGGVEGGAVLDVGGVDVDVGGLAEGEGSGGGGVAG